MWIMEIWNDLDWKGPLKSSSSNVHAMDWKRYQSHQHLIKQGKDSIQQIRTLYGMLLFCLALRFSLYLPKQPADTFCSDVPNPHQCKSSKFHTTTAAANRIHNRKQNINCRWLLDFPQIQQHGSLAFILTGMVWLFQRHDWFGLVCFFFLMLLHNSIDICPGLKLQGKFLQR